MLFYFVSNIQLSESCFPIAVLFIFLLVLLPFSSGNSTCMCNLLLEVYHMVYMSRVSSEMPSLVHNSLSIFIGPNIRVQKNYPHDFHALCLSMRKAMKQEMCPILFVAPLLVSSESFPIVPFNLSNIP